MTTYTGWLFFSECTPLDQLAVIRGGEEGEGKKMVGNSREGEGTGGNGRKQRGRMERGGKGKEGMGKGREGRGGKERKGERARRGEAGLDLDICPGPRVPSYASVSSASSP